MFSPYYLLKSKLKADHHNDVDMLPLLTAAS